ncbi:hypothetical protein BDR03DRAFT_1010160 [Suillus americanus]|nr:hypothetical protein BDR03DRAFT_1010160 [Suillus americanus]
MALDAQDSTLNTRVKSQSLSFEFSTQCQGFGFWVSGLGFWVLVLSTQYSILSTKLEA